MALFNKTGIIIKSAFGLPGAELPEVYDVEGDLVHTPDFLPTAVLTALSNVPISGTKQGACTDGEYIYAINFTTNDVAGVFIKYKITDGTYTTTPFDSSIPYNHANDMCYNPNNRHIYVAAMSSDGAVIEIDTDFNYVDTHYLLRPNNTPYKVWRLCFDQKTNRFMSDFGANDKMLIYDTNFNLVEQIFLSAIPSATAQGCETDGEYIYHIWYNPNLIHISTIGGTYVATMVNPMSGEPEEMMFDWIHKKYYINKNTSGEVFWEVQLTP